MNLNSYCSATRGKWPEVREHAVFLVQSVESRQLRKSEQVVNLALASQPPNTLWMQDPCRTEVVVRSGDRSQL